MVSLYFRAFNSGNEKSCGKKFLVSHETAEKLLTDLSLLKQLKDEEKSDLPAAVDFQDRGHMTSRQNKSIVHLSCPFNQVQVDLFTTPFYNHMPVWIPITVSKQAISSPI